MQGFGPGRKNGLQKKDENTGVLDNTLVFRVDTCVAEAGFPGHVGRRICSRWLMGRTGCSVMGYSAAPANPRDGPPEVSRIQTRQVGGALVRLHRAVTLWAAPWEGTHN